MIQKDVPITAYQIDSKNHVFLGTTSRVYVPWPDSQCPMVASRGIFGTLFLKHNLFTVPDNCVSKVFSSYFMFVYAVLQMMNIVHIQANCVISSYLM
jgi:hypothetical protein